MNGRKRAGNPRMEGEVPDAGAVDGGGGRGR